MTVSLEGQMLENFIVVGDRVLIRPRNAQERTKTGLYLPPGVQEKEVIHTGYIIKVGPGYPLPNDDDEPWKKSSQNVKYLPLQAQEGDLAVYLQRGGYEIEFNSVKYMIVPHSAILLLIRDEGLFQ